LMIVVAHWPAFKAMLFSGEKGGVTSGGSGGSWHWPGWPGPFPPWITLLGQEHSQPTPKKVQTA